MCYIYDHNHCSVLSYCFIMAFLNLKDSRVSPLFCSVTAPRFWLFLRGGAARVFHRAGRGTPLPRKAGRPSLVFLSRLDPDLVLGSWGLLSLLSLILAWEGVLFPPLKWGPNWPFRCLGFAQFVREDSWKCHTSFISNSEEVSIYLGQAPRDI